MARRDKPCTKEEFDNPNLINDLYEHVYIDGVEMTAQNIWDHPDREALVKKLVDYFYTTGFKPWKAMSDDDIVKQLLKFKDKDESEAFDTVAQQIKNSANLCLDICRHFCKDSFYKVRVNGTPSIEDVYKDKTLLEKVLKNRMGWYTSTETITNKGKNIVGLHPYLFDISHKMLVQGCHSSMVSANVSNFRPVVAKFLMKRYCNGDKILDLSAGWGARFLGAWALGKTYFGIDPMTAIEISQMQKFINEHKDVANVSSNCSKLIAGCSENAKSYDGIDDESIDYVIVCPPYFKLEEYQCKDNSTDVHKDYASWMNCYWKKTCEIAVKKMRHGAKFSLIMVEKWQKFELLHDMTDVLTQLGLKEFETLSYKTTRSHLTDKRKSGNTSKSTEKVVTFEKV